MTWDQFIRLLRAIGLNEFRARQWADWTWKYYGQPKILQVEDLIWAVTCAMKGSNKVENNSGLT